MKKVNLFVTLALLFAFGSANAQFRPSAPPKPGNRPPNPIQRNIERAAEKKAEEKAEEATNKAIDDGFEKAEAERARGEAEAERGLNKAAERLEAAQKAQEEADAKVAAIPSEIPEVSNTPYTPSEGEFGFFPMKKGAVQVFATKDAKGKVTSQTRNTIKGITGSKNAFAIAYESEILDANGKPTNKDNPLILNYRVVIKDGIMYLDMKEMFGAIPGLDGVQASGTAMKIPTSMSVGQTLDDAGVKVRIGIINCSAVMTEGKCVAIEDVTVEAGTFRSHKVTQKTNTTAMGVKTEGTTHTWYAKGAGAVKTETYDKKGNLVSVQELVSNN